jgi:hypothetical protein
MDRVIDAVRRLHLSTIGAWSGTQNQAVQSKIHLAFITFSIDRHLIDDLAYPLWQVFWNEHNIDKAVRQLMDPEDQENYAEYIRNDIGPKKEELGLLGTSALHVSQVFAMNNEYVGSWITFRTEQYTLRWLWIDSDWQHVPYGDYSALLAKVKECAGGGRFRYRTYGMLDRWVLLNAGEYGGTAK